MRRPPRTQDKDRDDVDKHRDNDDDDEHCGAVETNAGESNRDDEIKGANIEDAYSPSGTSSTSPVSPPHTVSDINSTLSVAGGSMQICPQSPPPPPPL